MLCLSHHRLTSTGADQSRAECWGLAASSAVHVVVIAAMSWWMLPGLQPPSSAHIDTTWDVEREPEQDLPAVLEISTDVASSPGGRAALLPAEAAMHLPQPRFELDVRVLNSPGPLVDAANLREAVPVARGAAGQRSGTGSGVGNGAGGKAPPSVEMFPIPTAPGRFVFVVDCSKSMLHRYPGPARTRLNRVKLELWRSIYRMTPEQKFFIVFFNTRAIPMPSATLVEGGPDGKSSLLEWTTGIRAAGQTDPYEALLLAVRLQPDEIFFLTDGEFNYRAVREVTKANFGGIRIHTIALGDDSGRRFLEEIAARNSGTFRHIVAEEDHYWQTDAASEPAPEAAPAPETVLGGND